MAPRNIRTARRALMNTPPTQRREFGMSDARCECCCRSALAPAAPPSFCGVPRRRQDSFEGAHLDDEVAYRRDVDVIELYEQNERRGRAFRSPRDKRDPFDELFRRGADAHVAVAVARLLRRSEQGATK